MVKVSNDIVEEVAKYAAGKEVLPLVRLLKDKKNVSMRKGHQKH